MCNGWWYRSGNFDPICLVEFEGQTCGIKAVQSSVSDMVSSLITRFRISGIIRKFSSVQLKKINFVKSCLFEDVFNFFLSENEPR